MTPNYELMLEKVYSSFLKPGDVVIDVGAHVGRHAFPCAELVGLHGKVVCIEPLPEQFKELSQLVEKRKSSMAHFILHNFALGEEECESEFVVVPDFPEYSGFKERLYHTDEIRKERITVNVKPLDSLILNFEHVKYIKIDAEGGELAILRGGVELINKFKPIISFELGDSSLVNYSYTASDFYEFFSAAGYSIYSIFGVKLGRDEFIECSRVQYFWDYIALPASQEWTAGMSPLRVMFDT